MSRTLVFHVGDRKTGTTSIQHVLDNDLHTAPKTVLQRIKEPMISHTLWAPKHRAHQADKWARLNKKLNASRADHVIVSDENFERCAPDELRDAIDTHLPAARDRQLRVVAYVRPHADRILSSYIQRFKHGHFTKDLGAFHVYTRERGEFMYAPRFGQWREVFGDQFTLRPMIRTALHGQDAVTDFLQLVTGQDVEVREHAAEQNTALSVQELAEMSVFLDTFEQELAHVSGIEPLKKKIRRAIITQFSGQGDKLRLHASLYEEIQNIYHADAEALDRTFFDAAPVLSQALDSYAAKTVSIPAKVDPLTGVSEQRRQLIQGFAVGLCARIANKRRAVLKELEKGSFQKWPDTAL